MNTTFTRDENGFVERAYVVYNDVMRYETISFFRKRADGTWCATLLPFPGKHGTMSVPEGLCIGSGALVFPAVLSKKDKRGPFGNAKTVWAIIEGVPMRGEYYRKTFDWECKAILEQVEMADMPKELLEIVGAQHERKT